MEIIEDNRFDKTMAVVAYLTLIGWVVALVMNNEKSGAERRFTAFHLRQMLGLMILAFVVWILKVPLLFIPFIGWLISFVLSVGLLILWALGIAGAAKGEQKELPYIGAPIQAMFRGIFD